MRILGLSWSPYSKSWKEVTSDPVVNDVLQKKVKQPQAITVQ